MVKQKVLDSIAIIKIDRPKQLNALSQKVLDCLESNFEDVINNEKVKVIIFTGSGEKAFIAGADILEMYNMSPVEAKNYAIKGQKLTQKIENSPKPIIGAINGFALGGGCEFAMACHIRYASVNALFGQPEVSLGLIAGFGGTQRLRRLVGKGIATELLLTGKLIDSKEALRIGLVNGIVKSSNLIFLAGQVSVDKEGNLVGENDITAQVTQIYQNIADALDSANAKFENIVQFSTYIVGADNIPAFLEKRNSIVTDIYPASDFPPSTLLVVAGLADPGYLAEVTAIAALP